MSRKITGYVERENGKPRYIRLTIPGTGRKRIPLPLGCSESLAEEKRAAWAERANRGELVAAEPPAPPPTTDAAPGPGETFAAWSKRWLAHREALGLTSVADDRSRFRLHVEPVLGSLAMGDITRRDTERLVEALDEKIASDALSWNTAGKVWTLVRTAFGDAVSSKRLDLRLLADDPTEKVAPPDRGDELARTYLYPAEFAKLVACPAISIEWRRLYALAAYTLSRAGELRALRWDAVDLERGVIHFRQASDRRGAGRVKSTKSGRTRRIPIEPALRPLLEALKAESGGTGAVVHVPESKNAFRLREHLRLAGLTRAELFEPPTGDSNVAATWAPLTFHDLRGTGVTWAALRGDEPLVIQQRAGHRTFATTQRYLREAEALGREGGVPFPPLPADVVGDVATGSGQPWGVTIASAGKHTAFWSGTRVSKAEENADSAGLVNVNPYGDSEPAAPNPAIAGATGHMAGHEAAPEPNPRADLVEALTNAVKAALLAGDGAAAAVALEALQRLLPPAGDPAAVVDLATARRERGSR